MRLEPILNPARTVVLTGVANRNAVLEAISALGHHHFPAVSTAAFLTAFKDREAKFPTGTPEGVAFPHALMPEIPSTALVAALLRPPVRWAGPNLPSQALVFGILGNSDTPWEHVRVLARIARVIRGPGALERLLAAADAATLHRLLVEEDRSHG